MLKECLGLDEVDAQIIKILQVNPNATHSEIAERVNLSQPTVGNRIKNLITSRILKFHAGFNIKTSPLYLAKLDVQSGKVEEIRKIVEQCPHVIHALRLSGLNNYIILIGSESLKGLDQVVNFHFRNNPKISKVSMELVTEIFNNFVLPLISSEEVCKCTGGKMWDV